MEATCVPWLAEIQIIHFNIFRKVRYEPFTMSPSGWRKHGRTRTL